jgi:glycosyltransferase involved in cell wall biosynthesis
MPLISVLLPVFNSENDLARAVCSLLNQTYEDFEIIAIDDGSTDASGKLLDRFAESDSRLHVYHQVNAGALGKVLNRAASFAKGKYLARQDADDASAPDRLEQQSSYMEAHPEIGVCGTWNWQIDTQLGPLFSSEVPDDHDLFLSFLKKKINPFIHGSVMMRADIFQKSGGYRGSLVEDFDLWLRMSENTRLGMLEKLGYYYWQSSSGISSGAHIRQQQLVKLVLKLRNERLNLGREVTSWEDEYQRIINAHVAESSPEERHTSRHYARSIHLMRSNHWDAARNELIQAAAGQGQYAQKARRNLHFFRFAPLVGAIYHLIETQELQHYARTLSAGTSLPEFLTDCPCP